MKKFFGSKKGALVILVAVLVFAGSFFYNQRQEGLMNDEYYGRRPSASGVQAPSSDVIEEKKATVLYEVRVRLEDLSLYSGFPSFVNELFTKEGEGTLDVKNYITWGWDGMLRGSLVSIEPRLEFFKAGDILMIKVKDRDLAMTVPGDIVTFYCEVKVLSVGNGLLSVPLKLTSCELTRINH